MNRRRFLLGSLAGAPAVPLGAEAQQAGGTTAKALALTILPSLLARADQVIE